MANPAPIIMILPAFNVDVGTIIDFNIIGGVSVVRSNKIYVYNMNNELIFTHLYTSMESLHELPAKTDSSIEYASGKSASDFNNKEQYYACIQTFTDVNGTEGASGFSTAKQFWTLPTPSLTLDTIPSTLTSTSYNFTAIYNNNMSVGDSDILKTLNLIQECRFDLYKAGGLLVGTSGTIIGTGEQQGVSTEYHESYNFNGLENNTTYYLVVTILTTENNILTIQSDIFTVSIEMPTLGSAVATNNACDGYITIRGNFSDSYDSSINKLLIKRNDLSNAIQNWVTLFVINVTQASDMDFVVLDFYNRYGRDYQYIVVPIMTQVQGDIIVEIEGEYTLSNEVHSEFNGVFIADNTAIQKFMAGVSYNSVALKQSVGVIETLGNKYPVIVSNNNLQYHTGSISAYVLHEGFYSTQDYNVLEDFITSDNEIIVTSDMQTLVALNKISVKEYRYSRTALVAAREVVTKFLTNKSPKILKDWNGNIWLVSFTSDIDLQFTNEWGMGIATFSATWTEIGDAENQYDLQNSGLINIGGV